MSEEKLNASFEELKAKVKLHYKTILPGLQRELADDKADGFFSKVFIALLEPEDFQAVKSALSPNLLTRLEDFARDASASSLSRRELERFDFEAQRLLLTREEELDFDALTKIQNMDLEQCRQFLEEHPGQGNNLLNYLNPRVAAKIVDELPGELLTQILSESEASIEDFQTLIKDFTEDRSDSPFLKTLANIAPRLSLEKERQTYAALSSQGKEQEARALAAQHLPSFLMSKLSAETLEQFLAKKAPDEIAKFLYSLEALERSEEREIFESALPAGNKKDSILMELSSIRANDRERNRLDIVKEEVAKDFFQQMRAWMSENIPPTEVEEIIREHL